MATSTIKSPYIEFQNAPPNGTNLNSLTLPGKYQIGNLTQYTNAPTGKGYSGSLEVDVVRSYIRQIVYLDGGASYRFSYDGGTTWREWK